MINTKTEHSFICRGPLRYELSDWLLTESRYPPRHRMNPHLHENAYFGIVLRGSYSERDRSKSQVCLPSTLVLRPAGEMHSVQFHDSSTHIFRVELTHAALAKVRRHSKLFDYPERLNTAPLFWMMTRLYKEFLQPDDLAPLSMEGIILEILAAASRAAYASQATCPPRLRRAREYVQASYTKPLRLGDVAAVAGVHPAYLAREFRRHYQTTLGEYVRRLRVEAACRALSATDARLSEIAASLGFSDQSHLGRQFKRLTGLTPAQYRAHIRDRS
ncbi:MAG TPA: AraC family transcriptional regulator [Pyrinomonadaceae bacterium]|nr:AraC family transcriptional regulator [Pyrinomonadaceae bacterium]